MCKKLLIVLVFLLVVATIVIIVICSRCKELPDGTELVKPPSFYEEKRTATLVYLTAVYPQGKESFEKMDSTELAIFYNSLWYYYNCEASFNEEFGEYNSLGPAVKHCWQTLPGCGTQWPKLPYTPQGYLYSFKDWVMNMWTPWIYSKSDKDPSYFTSSTPAVTMWTWYNGPSPMFMPQRCIVRMVYDPERPKLHTREDAYTPGVFHSINQPSLTPGGVGDFSSYWNYPNNWWLGNHRYLEVTYSDILNIGSGAMIWWNGMPGSGVFVDLGKSKKARNKVDGVLQLAREMSQTSQGRNKLKEWYLSDDPCDIVAGLMVSPCRETPPQVWDSINNKKIQLNFCLGAGYTFDGIPTAADGWSSVTSVEGTDWYSWCGKEKTDPNRPWAFGLPNTCIDDIAEGRSYAADRFSSTGQSDEALSAMGWWLGYDTIQLLQSANGNGFWQVEVLELRNFPPEVKQRDYSKFLQVQYDSKGTPTITWRFDNGWIKKYMDSISQYVSIRDPTDVVNENKAKKCVFPVLWEEQGKLGWTWNCACKGTMSEMFTKLSMNGATFPPTTFNQCYPGGLGFGKQPMNGPDSPPFG